MLVCVFVSAIVPKLAQAAAVEPLTLAELQEASRPDMSEATRDHINAVLNTPVVMNFTSGGSTGGRVNAGQFNINQFRKGAKLKRLFGDCVKFSGKNSKLRAQSCALVQSDVILLEEADDGVCRSGYDDSPEVLAKRGGFNYAEAPEFIEVEPKLTGLEQGSALCKKVDAAKTKNITANVVLSRFPITAAAIVPLENCHDWYKDELEGRSGIFRPRELRRGRRNALVTWLQIADSEKQMIVVTAHIENKTNQSCQRRQISQIVDALKNETSPVLLGGDFNTSAVDDPKFFGLLGKAGFDLSGNDDAFTFNFLGGLYANRFDWFAARDFKVLDARTLEELGDRSLSDHLPIYIEVNFRNSR